MCRFTSVSDFRKLEKMFSGLTNQVSSWMKKKQDGDAYPSPEGDEPGTTSSPKEVKDVHNISNLETKETR